MENLPQFERFKVHADPHTAGIRWEKWIIRFDRLLEAMNVVEKAADSADQKTATDKRRLALLLHYAGSEVEDVFDTLPGNAGDKDTYTKAKPLFQAYFQPKKNVELEVFNSEDQDKNLAKTWTLLQQDSVNSHQGVTSMIQISKLNYRLFKDVSQATSENCASETNSPYKKCWKTHAQQKPLIAMQKTLNNQQTANSINKSARKNSKFKSRNETGGNGKKMTSKCRKCGGQWPHTDGLCPGKGKCRNYGYDWPHSEAKPCPAKGKKCESC